jgi:hypothetical protein
MICSFVHKIYVSSLYPEIRKDEMQRSRMSSVTKLYPSHPQTACHFATTYVIL